MSEFDPTQYIRLSELADALPWSYEALRQYGESGVLTVTRRGSTLYIRRCVASEMLSGQDRFSNLRELINHSLDNTPNHVHT